MKALQDSTMSTKELVAAFNALPRNPKAPSGLVPNEWHFDLRFIQIEPTPSHIVSFVQPQSQFTHMERLPLGLSHSESGMAYFPDTAKEAAPMLVKAILYAFVNNLGMKEMPIENPPAPYAPWKLTTEDKELAAEVSLELKRIGVSAEGLYNVGISKKSTIKIADETFKSLFNGIKMATGFHGIAAVAISTPDSIQFTGFKVPDPEPIYQRDDDDEDRLTALTLEYCNWKSRVSPSDGTEIDGKKLGEEMWKAMMVVKEQLKTKNERVIKEAADCGDPEAALEYGMRYDIMFHGSFIIESHFSIHVRLGIGLGCTRDRKLMHDYLIQAAYSASASKKVKAMAHGRLINWYIDSAGKGPGSYMRSRYLFGAAHHCNEAAKLCRDVSPRGAPASPVVLFFMNTMFQKFSSTVLELNLWYKDAIKAFEDRNKQYEKGQNKMAEKRLKHPNRYRCAAPGCGVQSDAGSMLAKCKSPAVLLFINSYR